MSLHVLSDVEDTCERVALIRQGRIVRTGTVEELREGQARTMVVEFCVPPADGLAISGATVLSQQGATWRLGVTGDVNDVVRELARYDLRDLVYERLSLEELFMDYYHQQPDETSGEGAAND
jgi:ABC-2 type transport system ATP-binding protein